MLRIVSLPPFRAAVSGADPKGDFSPNGALGRFDQYFSALQPSPRDSFMPRDFLYYDQEQGGMVWMYALAEGLSDGGFPTAASPRRTFPAGCTPPMSGGTGTKRKMPGCIAGRWRQSKPRAHLRLMTRVPPWGTSSRRQRCSKPWDMHRWKPFCPSA